MVFHNKIANYGNIKSANQKFLQKRREIVKIIRETNKKLQFNSQTFFSAIYYMDMIFIKNVTMSKMSDFILTALSCLSLSAKYNENDPHVPEIRKFISALSDVTKFRYRFSLDAVFHAEIYSLRMLDYNLTYFSLYQFLSFFFTHGVVFDIYRSQSIKEENLHRKMIEKIYLISREVINYIIEGEFLIVGDDCYLTCVALLEKAVEYKFGKGIYSVFTEIYGVNQKRENYRKIQTIIQGIFDSKVLKKEQGKINKAIQRQKNVLNVAMGLNGDLCNNDRKKSKILFLAISNEFKQSKPIVNMINHIKDKKDKKKFRNSFSHINSRKLIDIIGSDTADSTSSSSNENPNVSKVKHKHRAKSTKEKKNVKRA